MRSLIYPGLLGCIAAACLLETVGLAHVKGAFVSPDDAHFLSVLCWCSIATSGLGVFLAVALRRRTSKKAMSTLIISFCGALLIASVWARVALLPRDVGVPMELSLKAGGETSAFGPLHHGKKTPGDEGR